MSLKYTKHNEIALIKEDSISAASAFAGALVGFALPLSSVMLHALSLLDLVLWGVVAMVVQIVAYFLVLGTTPTRSPVPGEVNKYSDRGQNSQSHDMVQVVLAEESSHNLIQHRVQENPFERVICRTVLVCFTIHWGPKDGGVSC